MRTGHSSASPAISDLNRTSLSNRELVEACLKTDAADYAVVEHMMDRLWPGWHLVDR